MEVQTAYRRQQPEPLAPVAGGMRWRRPYHDIFELCRRDRGLAPHDPDAPERGDPVQPERGTDGAPRIVSIPPCEARAGTLYVYPARACDGYTDGFTWYFEKCAPGMHVDRHTGRVTWTPSGGGYVDVVLCARSVYGGESRQAWTICVRRAFLVREPVMNRRFAEALRRKSGRTNQPLGVPRRGGAGRWPVVIRAASPPGVRLRMAVPLRI